MTTNLLELARAQLTPEVIQRASSLVGETPASTQRAMEAAAPTIVAGLVQEGSSVAGANHLLELMEASGLTGSMAGVAERNEAESGALDSLIATGKELFGRLFGGRVGTLVEVTATSSGVRRASMSSLLGLTTPLLLGVLGTEVATQHLDAAGLAALLSEQRSNIAKMLPTGAAAALGLSTTSTREPVDTRAVVVTPPRTRFPWLLLLAIPLALLIGYALRNRTTSTRGRETIPSVVVAPPGVRAPAVGEGTVSEQLERFLVAPVGAVPARFVLDKVHFEDATAQLVPTSATALDRLASTLAQHSSAQILIEGHTDYTGDAESNRILSLNRAQVIKEALVARGVEADRISAAGLGSERPIVSKDASAAERQQNWRTEIVVLRR